MKKKKDGSIDKRTLVKGPLGLESPSVGLRLEKDRFDRLESKAKELGGVSRSEVVRRALEEYGI